MAGIAGCLCAMVMLGAAPAVASEAYVAVVAAEGVDSADAALRDAAIARAEEEALATVLRRLTASRDHARLPVAAGPNVAGYVEDVAVLADGRRLRITLRADAVRAMLDGFGIGYLDTPAPALVVVPVIGDGGAPVLWSGANPWLDAWRAYPAGAGLTPLVVPYAELGDVAALSPSEAVAGDTTALRRLAGRYQAAGTVVAVYGADGGQAEIRISVAADGWQAATTLTAPPVTPIPPETVAAVAAAVDRLWVESGLQPSYDGPTSVVEMTASFGSLADWIAIRRALDEASIVARFDVPLVGGTSARLVLHHYADLGTLQRELAVAGLVVEQASLEQNGLAQNGLAQASLEQNGRAQNGLPGLTVRYARSAPAPAPQPPDSLAAPGMPLEPGWSASAPPPPTLTIAPRMPTLRFEP